MSNNSLQNYFTTNDYKKKMYAIIGGLRCGGLKSGWLKSGGLMSGGLMSGGLKFVHRISSLLQLAALHS